MATIKNPNAPARGETSEIVAALKATKLQYLRIDYSRHGKMRVMVRRHGKTIQLRAKPLTPEFYQEYGIALGELSSITPLEINLKSDTLAWLILEYMRSGRFAVLADETKKVRRRVLNNIAAEFGDLKFAKMNRFDIEKIRAQKIAEQKPAAAEHRRKVLKQVFVEATAKGLITHDPFHGVETSRDNKALRAKTHEKNGTSYTGHWTWTTEQVEQFFDYWPSGTTPHICMALMYYLGVRISDAQKLGPRDECSGRMIWTTSKRVGKNSQGVEMDLPIIPPLREAIDAVRSSNLVSLENFVLTKFGSPFSQKSLSHWFSERAKMAGLPTECTAHGVRKALAKRLAESGASSSELKATFGWSTSKLADLYTEQASKKDLATSSLERMKNKVVTPNNSDLSHHSFNPRKSGIAGS